MTRQTQGRGLRYASILDTVGDTPVVRLNRIAPEHVELYVKVESFNPGGSVKDRLALNIIETAERDGRLTPGQTVVEATSGNTGIGLAMVCAAKGYPLVITMAESFSVERRRLMRFLGARVVLTPRAEKGLGMVRKAQELAAANGWILASHFETPANAEMHENTTAREIFADFSGERLDAFVTGYGTGGTVTGVARALRRSRPDTRIVLAEPEGAALVASGHVNARNEAHQPTESHPSFSPHPIQGWTPDFIPFVMQEALDEGYLDEVVTVSGAEGMAWARRLAREEGIFTGVSGGSTLAAAVRLAEVSAPGTVILAMLPDTGERYLSTPLFDGVAEDMSEEEWAISRSTPGQRMG